MSPDRDVDEHLLRQTAAGDRAAFETLYRAYHRRLYGYLFRLVRDTGLAEELTSDVMVEVWRGAARFKGASRVSTWMFGIARHKALSARRRPVAATVDVTRVADVVDPGHLPDDVVAEADMKQIVERALHRLSDEHREVMDLTFYQGFSYPEIAQIVGCPVSTVKTRMFHARLRLRKLLAEVDPHEA
jgi:RNA polymerase sigma-70 factor (ECF subfamily)